MRVSLNGWILVLTLLSGLAGCASDAREVSAGRPAAQGPAGTAAGETLYDRLGGEKTIRAVVDDFIDKAVADPRVNFTRRGTGEEWNTTPARLEHFKRHFVNLIAEKAGGPQKYRGRDMRRVHKGMQISNAQFDAFVAHLGTSLNEATVPSRERDEMIRLVESTRAEIVEAGAR